MNIMDKGKNQFKERTEIKYNENVERYLMMAAEFIEGYFREDWRVSKMYADKKYKDIIKY